RRVDRGAGKLLVSDSAAHAIARLPALGGNGKALGLAFRANPSSGEIRASYGATGSRKLSSIVGGHLWRRL
ncbi:MAG TPA: hypothetical protein VNQ14_12210, partial [Woeseiaceae bacterium]|nr:hypothetical protein [Woeseiaceae bacterium]